MLEVAQEIFNYLPIRRNVHENDYIGHLWSAFSTLDDGDEVGRPFSIMPFHLLFMLAIQYKTLRISKVHKKSCELFFCGVAGRNKKELIADSLSVFDFALINERTLPELFQLIDVEAEKISVIKKLIDDRNDLLAHAKGGIETLPEEKIASYVKAIQNIRDNFHPLNQEITENLLADLTDEDDITQLFESLLQLDSLDKNDLTDVANLLLESKKLTQSQWIQFAEYLLMQFEFEVEVIKEKYGKRFDLTKETYTDRSLFFEELAKVTTNQMLDIVRSNYPNLDPYYLASACIEGRARIFDRLWQNFKPYADRHFLKQAKTNFHQRSWEMYMANVLIERGFTIASSNEGPDFIVNDLFYLECIASSKGEPGKPDSVPEMYVAKKTSEIFAQDVPVDKIILRITQSFKDKALLQYEKWKSKKWFEGNKPFIVAINTGELEWPQDYFGIPLVIKALFGLQYMQVSQNGNKGFSWRNQIDKGDGVPVTYFAGEDFKFVSGVVFSDKSVLNHPEIIGDDCIFINNPFADHPVPQDFYSKFKNWKAEKNKVGITLQMNY